MSNSNIYLRVAVIALAAHSAWALDPNRLIGQYLHDRWGAQDGFPGDAVNALAEDGSGYLWIGSEKGLVRFDGSSFRLFNHANTNVIPGSPVLGLSMDAQGDLWIRLQSPGMLRYSKGVFHDVFPGLRPEVGVTAMGRGRKGDILLARSGDPLRYRDGKLEQLAPNVANADRLIISVAESADGTVWMGTRDAGAFSLLGTSATMVSELPDRKVNCILAGEGSDVWLGTDGGLVRWNGRAVTVEGIAPELRKVQVLALTRDHDGNVWVGANSGLMRVNAKGVVAVDAGRGPVNAIYEDREGNLWVGGMNGIERYRDSVFLTVALSAGAREVESPVYADASRRTWFAPPEGGLAWTRDGVSGRVDVAGLGQDIVYSIDGGGGEVWVGRQRGGLTRLREREGFWEATTYTPADGLARGSVFAVHRNRDGTAWMGTLGGGVSHVEEGRVSTFTTKDGLASNSISAIEEGADGSMWIATPNGLSAFKEGRWQTYSSDDGLPPGRVNCLTEDSGGVLWIGTDAGLVYRLGDRIRAAAQPPHGALAEILGIADDGHGWLWLVTARQVLRVSRAQLLGEGGAVEVRVFGQGDGLKSTEGVRRNRSAVTDPLGRVWIALRRELAIVDPARLTAAVPAVVHVESVSADGGMVSLGTPVRIPPSRQRITFGFIGLSLSVPERVRFRYRLDPFDRDWSELVASRETVYTNLSPGSYRFRLLATDSEGGWTSAETKMDVEVTPALTQTWWFHLSALLTGLAVVVMIYRLRLRQLTGQLNLRFEERLAERTRIAQDLHDTLLQGLLSASMQLHVAVDGVPAELPANRQLKRVLQLMQVVVEEGRHAVSGLRSTNGIHDLEGALTRLREENIIPDETSYRVIVEGKSRELTPIIRDEVHRIAREALMNAFRHSKASEVEVELDYTWKQLRLVVRDNGVGIDEEVLKTGREGHWGLVGMQERAVGIGARLKVWSRTGGGTEVELTVPSNVAYPRQEGADNRWWKRWRRATPARRVKEQ